MQEIYAPLHERVDIPAENSLFISQADLQSIVGDNVMSNSDIIKLVAKVDSFHLPIDALKIVFVNKPITRDATDPEDPEGESPDGVSGQLQVLSNGPGGDGTRDDIVLCPFQALAKIKSGSTPDFFVKYQSDVVAHECGHCLRGYEHRETEGIFSMPVPIDSALLPGWHLMAEGSISHYIQSNDPVKSGKHWYLKDEEIVHNARGNKYSKKIK
jgi:hypothetical protein